MRTVTDEYALSRWPFRRPRAQDDREDVVSVGGTVVKNYLQAPTEDVLGPVYPATESTDPLGVTPIEDLTTAFIWGTSLWGDDWGDV